MSSGEPPRRHNMHVLHCLLLFVVCVGARFFVFFVFLFLNASHCIEIQGSISKTENRKLRFEVLNFQFLAASNPLKRN